MSQPCEPCGRKNAKLEFAQELARIESIQLSQSIGCNGRKGSRDKRKFVDIGKIGELIELQLAGGFTFQG